MKNLILIIVGSFFLVFSSNQLHAQAYQKGELAVSPGVGFIGLLANYTAFPVVVNAEYGLTDVISAGGFVGVRYLNTENVPAAINPAAGIRISGHFFPAFNQYLDMSLDESKVDVYLTVLTGFELTSKNYPGIKNFIAPRPALGVKYF